MNPPAPPTLAAYCDVDGTLTHTDIAAPLIWMKKNASNSPFRWIWLAGLLIRGPWWLILDRFSRSASNRAIYSNYKGMSSSALRKFAASYYTNHIRPKMFPKAFDQLTAFRKQNIQIVLVTGGLDLYMAPMAKELDAHCLAPSLEEANGSFTGRLNGKPFTGAEKTAAMLDHARKHSVDLSKSYALGDALGDLPMLEAVGNPWAINPDARLAKIARQRGWKTEVWK